MRITRLYLRNYRVYEEPLELEIPPGLVGIYGVNGAGKSALLEAIAFTLWGKARTNKDEVRTAGIVGDCVTEVAFEHEGHLYVVRRTISGASATVRAEAHADGSQVSEGVKDTARYVHSVLGMDEAAFKASVFAEQKQLAAFSVRQPAERRALVLGLLGITPLDAARDQARRDARDAHAQLVQIRAVLADLGAIEVELASEAALAVEAAESEVQAATIAASVAAEAAEAEAELRRLDALGRRYDALVVDGRARRTEHDGLAERAQRLEGEARALSEAEGALAGLEAAATGLVGARACLVLVDTVAGAVVVFERAEAGVPTEPARVDPDRLAAVLERAHTTTARLAELEGRRSAAADGLERAASGLARSGELSGEADCPLCGQALGGAFEAVQAHRREEFEAAEATLAALLDQSRCVAAEAGEADEAVAEMRAEHDAAEAARIGWERATGRLADAGERLSEALAAARAGGVATEGLGRDRAALSALRDRFAAEVGDAQRCSDEAATLRGRLERRQGLDAEMCQITARLGELETELAALRASLRGLEYQPEALLGAAQAAEAARASAQAAQRCAQAAELAAATAQARVHACVRRAQDARQQHRHLDELAEQARHLGRTAELLGAFRNAVVGSVGPRLSSQANDLFAELTDHEYDGLEVDPETYEIKICDHGSTFGMDRFSGSETDLANLALRVAISEQVTLLSGGAVGLLVLDEVFGPLDADRKERLVLALERLKGRFRQVLVVTHDPEMKEQLPSAIEVLKLPGRRATARVL
ncbi:MAG: AAA family ATPase [Acidimicrobiales bacterium]